MSSKIIIKQTPENLRRKELLLAMEAKSKPVAKTFKISDDALIKITLNKVKREIQDKRYELLRDGRYFIPSEDLLKYVNSNNFKQKFNTNLKAFQALNEKQDESDKRTKTRAIRDSIKITLKRHIANDNKLEKFKNITVSTKQKHGYNKIFEKKLDNTVFKNNIVQRIKAVDLKSGRMLVESLVYDNLKKIPEGIYQIKYVPNHDDKYGVIDPVLDIQIDTRGKTPSDLYTELISKMTLNSEISIPDYYNDTGSLFILKPSQIQRAEKRELYNNQYFLDGDNFHCVFKPIEEHFYNLYVESLDKSKKTQANHKSKYNKILKLTEEFKDGINRNEIQNICNDLNIAIDFVNMFDNSNTYDEFRPVTPSFRKIFKYFNSRTNHLENKLFDLNNITYLDNFDCLKEKYQELKKNKVLFYHKKDINGVVEIYTQDCIYKVKEYDETIKLFKDYKNQHLSDKYINKTVDGELSNFVEKSLHFLGAVDFTKSPIGGRQSLWYDNQNHPIVGHIDQQKAYYNVEKCTYYEGMLGKITDFRACDKIERIGLYKIYDIDYINCNEKFQFYCDKLNFLENNNIYPSPLLKYISEQGITFKIKEGCWGEKFDMKLPKEFLNKPNPNNYKDIKRPALYSVFIGSLSQIKPNYNIYFETDKNSADVISQQEFSNNDYICTFDETTNEYCVSLPKKDVKHLSQITSFVTCYTAINTLEQLMDMNENSVIRVVADGIYYLKNSTDDCIDDFEQKVEVDDNLVYSDEITVFKNIFRNEIGNHFGTNNSAKSYFSNIQTDYYSHMMEKELDIITGEYKEYFPVTLYEGCGGTGKSYICLKDKGAIGKMYFAPSKKLKRNKSIEFKDENVLGYYTVQKLLRLPSDPTKWIDPTHKYILKNGRNLYIDECSMLNEDQKNHLINIFKPLSVKLHFMGDIGYQLRPIEGNIMNNTNIDKIITLTHNYRIKDEKLLNFIHYLRNIITNRQYDEKTLDEVLKSIQRSFQLVNKNKLINDYQLKDYIITWTNDCADRYDELLKDKFIDEKKYYIIKGDKRTYETGDIIISKTANFENCQFMEKYAFTTHKLQGETIESTIYIDIRNMLSVPNDWRDLFYELLHTAVGRVHYSSQIKFII
jgi:hypothetical protein